MRYLIVILVIIGLAVIGCASPTSTPSSQPPIGTELVPNSTTSNTTPSSSRTVPKPVTLAPPPSVPPIPPNWTPPPPAPTPPFPQTANSTAFEMIVHDYKGLATGPYKLLVVRLDGLVYYEEGYNAHLFPTAVTSMKQGQIYEQEVTELIHILDQFPYQIQSEFSRIAYDVSTPTLPMHFSDSTVLYFPVAQTGIYRGKAITANYDPFTRDLAPLTDVPLAVKELWKQLKYIIENATAPTSTHPDLYPSFRP
jgi:hypothetical protein